MYYAQTNIVIDFPNLGDDIKNHINDLVEGRSFPQVITRVQVDEYISDVANRIIIDGDDNYQLEVNVIIPFWNEILSTIDDLYFIVM